MKNTKKFLFLIIPIIISIIFGYQYNINHPKENAFSVYLVTNLDLTKEQKTPIQLKDLELEKEPFFEINEIEKYYWKDSIINGYPIKSHSFKLNKILAFKTIEGSNTQMIPFVLFVNGKRYCFGSFHAVYSSMSLSSYADITISQTSNPTMVYHIIPNSKSKKDVRADKSIYRILKKYHKLK